MERNLARWAEKEIRDAVFAMEHNKAPGLDGFPAEFYQKFWDIIKDDIMQMFLDLHAGDLPLFSLNFGVITLVPKVLEANRIQQYRPICLLNVSFKIFTKVAIIRVNSIADHLVSPTQTAFMRGRNILEGVVILHETIHVLHSKKQSGVILKIDFEKAYDKVQSFTSGGSGAVNVNDEVGPYFQTKKGLRQGDPLSPIFFNIVADMLAILINRAKVDGQISGVVSHLVDGGLSILQYADDTIIFMDNDLEQARNMKLLLCAFEQVSGLKINFHKSEIYCFGAAQQNLTEYMQLFGCNSGDLPMRYLGIPIHYRRLSNIDWRKVEERFKKRLSSRKSKHLSTDGRLTLINSVLSSLPMYMMSFFAIPKGVLRKLDYFRSRFFWQCDEGKRKYRLAKWDILCQPKDQGGLEIHNLDVKNTALLSKWLYNLLTSDGTWQQILRNKYLRSKPLSQAQWKNGDSYFWACLMKVKHDFLRFETFLIKNGSQVKFWEDRWLGQSTLREQYPCLYNIARYKQATVAVVLGTSLPNISWRRDLIGNKLAAWNNLLPRLANVVLCEYDDIFHWNLHRNGKFSVKSHYLALIHTDVPNINKRLWSIKVLLKIKIFLWYLRKGIVLTKDNLAKRNWQGSKQCCFCHKDETIKHLFFECRFARAVWAIIHAAFGLAQPRSVSNMFGSWLVSFKKEFKPLVLLGAAATCWSLWLSRNNLVFEKKQYHSPLQLGYSLEAIFLGFSYSGVSVFGTGGQGVFYPVLKKINRDSLCQRRSSQTRLDALHKREQNASAILRRRGVYDDGSSQTPPASV
ncbi:hypothetical protein U9M48_004264 [Paspalum notatum var. saurae]|uniref:Reverse transcriptase domain-containing protein n=1 Tax=Paspalum notatum var. saurae TaxID=547442 RepID=A0AAQ3SL80_PASNO